MKRLKIAFAAMVLILTLMMAYLIYRNTGHTDGQKTAGKLINPSAELSLKSPHFIEMDDERKVFEVDADEAYYYKGDEILELKGPKLVLYDKNGNKTFISGDRGFMDRSSNEVEVKGNVRVDYSKGYHLKTPSLRYSNVSMTISTDNRVRVTGDGFEIEGVGMKADVEGESIRILSRVVAVFERSFRGEELWKD